jgi:Spy/CpxP family protein refolding chaperone
MRLTTLNEVIMKNIPTAQRWSLLALMLSMAIISPSSAFALQVTHNEEQAQQAQQPPERAAQPIVAPQDPITQLNLSPEQRQQIRSIREETKDERAAINRRLRETQIALNQALNADSPNEALIEQRAREAGEAQAAAVRMRALMQTRIRRVLTLEQANTLRQLQAKAQEAKKEQRQESRANESKAPAVNRRPLPNQRNGIAPVRALRRDGLPRKPQH